MRSHAEQAFVLLFIPLVALFVAWSLTIALVADGWRRLRGKRALYFRSALGSTR